MSCGYVCPQCEGKGILDSGELCDYCSKPPKKEQEPVKVNQISEDAREGKA
ncbi:MAG: hypothetical protein ACOVP1_03515 [Bacteroidia bacterium]